jgi:hypothetical protein
MKTLVRGLMWAHFVYLLLLPTLAVVSARMLFPGSDDWQAVAIFGFPATMMYSLFLANGYALPDSLPIALFQTLVIPLQIWLGVFIYGTGSIWLFFAESAAVGICSFVFGVLTVALMNREKEMSVRSFALLLLMALVVFFGGTLPFLILVFAGYGSLSPWLILFVTAFATGYWGYAQTYQKLTAAYNRKGTPQNLEMLFDGGRIFKLLNISTNVPLISPLWKSKDRTEVNKRVFIFGFGAAFLPAIAAGITSIFFDR